MPEFVIDIRFDLDASGIEEASSSLQDLQSSADELSSTTESMDASSLDDMGSSAEETSENIKEASNSMGELGERTDETSQKMQETAESSAGIGTALVGIGGAIGFDAMITKADNLETSMNRLSLTFDGTGVSTDTLKQKSAELSAETGRSGGEIRDYFNKMGIAGVTNVDLLTNSFSSLAGASYKTGTDISTLQTTLQGMVLTGNASGKMLKNLGLSTTQLASAMGVTEEEAADMFKSLSEEERLNVITKAMGDGTEANEMYKNSYAGLKAQAEASLGGLMSAIGQSILPIVIPALQTAKNVLTQFTNVWKGLPAPVTTVFGALGGGVVAVTTLVGVFGTLGKVGSSVVSGLRSMKNGYDSLKSAMGTAKMMIDAVRNAESLSEGVKTALAIATGTETVAEGANATAKGAAVAPTSALAIAENSLLLPILLLVGAIIGLVAVLYYLYNNNEQVRQAVDGLIESLGAFVGQVMGAVSEAINGFISWLGDLYNWLSGVGGAVSGALTEAINFVAGIIGQITNILNQIWTTVITWFNFLINSSPQQTLRIIMGVITTLNPFAGLVMGVLSRVLPVFISAATSWITNTVNRAKQLVSQVQGAISQLGGKISSALSGVAGALTRPFQQAWSTVKPIVDKFEQGVAWAKQLLHWGNANIDLPTMGIEITSVSSGLESMGYDVPTNNTIEYNGLDNNLNNTITKNVENNNSNINTTFNINGIIEETASEYIVDSVNSYIKKQNLVRGV